MPPRFRPTVPVEEYAADRVAVFFDRSDLAYLAAHCCCGDDADELIRERCGRVRFRCMAAVHKLDAKPAEVCPGTCCDFVAFISLVPSDRGGRQSGISSGYRPQLFIDGEDCDIAVTLEDEPLNPGESAVVYCSFFRPELHLRRLVVGKAVLFREGSRAIAYGTILWRRIGEHSHAREPAAEPVSNGE